MKSPRKYLIIWQPASHTTNKNHRFLTKNLCCLKLPTNSCANHKPLYKDNYQLNLIYRN